MPPRALARKPSRSDTSERRATRSSRIRAHFGPFALLSARAVPCCPVCDGIGGRTMIGPELVAASAAMRRIASEVERAAALSSTVLLLGETGVGKGLVARTLHARSPRHPLPLVHADC